MLVKKEGMVWKDAVEKRFFWATMGQEVEKLLYELMKAEEEEDAGIYLLKMHYDHAKEPLPFTAAQKEKIQHLLSVLIGETHGHQKLLQEMITQLEKEKPS